MILISGCEDTTIEKDTRSADVIDYWVVGEIYSESDIHKWCNILIDGIKFPNFTDNYGANIDNIVWFSAGYINTDELESDTYYMGLYSFLQNHNHYGTGKYIFIVFIEISLRKVYLQRIGLNKYKCILIDDCQW